MSRNEKGKGFSLLASPALIEWLTFNDILDGWEVGVDVEGVFLGAPGVHCKKTEGPIARIRQVGSSHMLMRCQIAVYLLYIGMCVRLDDNDDGVCRRYCR